MKILRRNDNKAMDLDMEDVIMNEENVLDRYGKNYVGSTDSMIKKSDKNTNNLEEKRPENANAGRKSEQTSSELFAAKSMKGQKKLSEINPMELPEGTYFVSKDNSIINLPEPVPAYCAKRERASGNKEAQSHTLEGENETRYKNSMGGSGAAEQTNEKVIIRSLQKTEFAKNFRASGSTHQNNKNSDEMESVSQDTALSDDITKVKAELVLVKKQLEKEKQENQILTAKLEISTELLLKLYKE